MCTETKVLKHIFLSLKVLVYMYIHVLIKCRNIQPGIGCDSTARDQRYRGQMTGIGEHFFTFEKTIHNIEHSKTKTFLVSPRVTIIIIIVLKCLINLFVLNNTMYL